ncbi:MAG: type II secretion system F family protein, partial [Verrucomicrobia bacterium]|nr:type II secretion system F family protein [Deltaproteobacteria bacterium]
TFIIGAEVVGNTVLSEKLRAISPALMSGDSISDAMRRTGYIQDLVLDMVSIAEKTGKLEDALNRASDILDKEVPDTIKKLVALIEPLTMVLLGGLVLLLLLSVFLPIYKVVGNIRVR